MKFFRIDLLTLLISLFILSSCKNPDGIGLPVDPTRAIQANLIDTSTINTITVVDDTVQTEGLTKLPLAYFKDPVLGTTEANIAMALNLPGTSSYTTPTGTLYVDSAMLVLKYADGFYGDSLTSTYKANVYQLNEPITSKAYYNNKSWSIKPALLGSRTFVPRPKTGFKITNIVTGAKDTLAHVNPELRISLDHQFFITNFFNATSNQLTTNSVFQNFIQGLYVTLDKSQQGAGGTMFFNMSADSSSVDIYYHTISTDGNATIDTEMVSLPVGTPHAAQIKHDYTNAAATLKTQLADTKTNATYGTVYVQGLSGLKTKISFPYLQKLLAAQQINGNDIVVNRAELVVTPVAGSGVPFPPLQRLTLYRNDIALQRQLVPDAYSADIHYLSVGSFGGYYDPYHQSYSYIITGLVEDLMRNKLTDYGTYIAPTDTTGSSAGTATVDISNTAQVDGRAILGGNKTSPYQMKLNILYNKVTK
jgi:hypothetical protein